VLLEQFHRLALVHGDMHHLKLRQSFNTTQHTAHGTHVHETNQLRVRTWSVMIESFRFCARSRAKA
jgi:hypothetical protein